MNKRLLTLDDLYKFYSTKKKSMKFNADKEGYNLSVQVRGKFEVVNENEEALMFCRVKAFHDLGNLNKSYIDTDVLKEKMYSINNRPILADIVEVEDEDGNKVKDFSGHSMKLNEEEDKIEYIEIPVGHFINPDNIELAYDEEHDRNFVYCDAVIYEEYTDTCDILRRRGGTDVSVELAIRDLAFDCKSKVLKLNDFYVQGCTLLGADVRPGMAGSKLSLKDFSESNNSMFSDMTEDEYTKLVDTLEKLNKTLENISKFNIDETNTQEDNMKGGVTVKKDFETNEDTTLNNEVDITETESTEVIETEGCKPKKKNEKDGLDDTETFDDSESGESDGTTDTSVDDTVDTIEDETVEDTTEIEEVIENEDSNLEDTEDNKDDDLDDNDGDNKKQPFSKTFEISFGEITQALYSLLSSYEEANNDWYWICDIYDNHFVYQSCCTGSYFGQNYVKDGDNVAFDGERYELYSCFLTQSEKTALDNMRSNYSSIEAELNKYKEAEEFADKMTVFEDESYSDYLETEEFKSLMDKENVKKFTKEELSEKADAALGKLVKKNKMFSFSSEKKDEKKANFFAFARQEQNTSFLDNLLKK